MAKLLENKQIVHIVSEVVVLSGLTLYFSQVNKRLTKNITELNQKLEEQSVIIENHEQVIQKLVQNVNNITIQFHKSVQKSTPKQGPIKQSIFVQKQKHVDLPLKTTVQQPKNNKIKIEEVSSEDDEDDEEEDDEEDLDDILAEELGELSE
jgi:enoyl-[acyl-carrier-protein] reductase (NADH)